MWGVRAAVTAPHCLPDSAISASPLHYLKLFFKIPTFFYVLVFKHPAWEMLHLMILVLIINNSSLQSHWGADAVQHLPKHSYREGVSSIRSMLPSLLLLIAPLDSAFDSLCICNSSLWVSKFRQWKIFLSVPFLLVSLLLPFLWYHLLSFHQKKSWEAHGSDNSTIFCSAEIIHASFLYLWVLLTWVWLKNLLLDLN